MAAAVAAMKPFSTGAGARTSPNTVQAVRRSSPARPRVSAVGSSHQVVSGNRVHAMKTTATPAVTTAASTRPAPDRRSRVTTRWATTTCSASGHQ